MKKTIIQINCARTERERNRPQSITRKVCLEKTTGKVPQARWGCQAGPSAALTDILAGGQTVALEEFIEMQILKDLSSKLDIQV